LKYSSTHFEVFFHNSYKAYETEKSDESRCYHPCF